MALADYFNKSALAASQVLGEFDLAAFEGQLQDLRVGIAFDGHAASTPGGRWTMEMALTLLGRLYPSLSLIPLDALAASHADKLARVALHANRRIEITTEADNPAPSVILCVGSTAPSVKAPTAFLGTSGWIARVSTRSPIAPDDSPTPFASGAAACLGAALVFRGGFMDASPVPNSLDIALSTWAPASGDPGSPIHAIDMEDAHLVGAGAIGNSASWALARIEATGSLHVVDHETLEESNAQRYVLMREGDADAWKTDTVEREFAEQGSGVRVEKYPRRWGQYLASCETFPRLSRVIVAVDSAADRIAIQAARPVRIINAWTQTGDLGVSVHDFSGDTGCLACLYFPTGPVPSLSHLVADALAIPEPRIRPLLATGQPADEALIDEIATGLSVKASDLARFVGRPLREMYVEAACGGLLLSLGASKAAQAEVPMAFQSALAGLLSAAAFARDAMLRDLACGEKTVLDVLSATPRPMTVRLAPAPRCFCQDLAFRTGTPTWEPSEAKVR